MSSPAAIVLAFLWVAGSVSALVLFPRDVAATAAPGTIPEPSQDQRSELERFMSTAPRVPLAVSAEGAKVLIVKFADYQCPACGQAYTAYKPILAKYAASNPGQVRMVMKDYPLNSACNDGLFCTDTDRCNGAGACTGSGNPCPGSDNDCDCSEHCSESANNCTANDPNGVVCGGGTGACAAGTCVAIGC